MASQPEHDGSQPVLAQSATSLNEPEQESETLKNMASAHRRHQDSLERFLDFPSSPPLTEEVRDQAETKFRTIVDHFLGHDHLNDEYDRTTLVRYTYEYALTGKAKDNLLQAFMVSMAMPLSDTVQWMFDSVKVDNQTISSALVTYSFVRNRRPIQDQKEIQFMLQRQPENYKRI